MITKVIMPQMSLTMQVGVITEWIKSVGDKVSAGDALCVVEGDKATVDIESPVDGYLIKIFANLDEEFPVKQPIALIGDSPDIQGYDTEALMGSAQVKGTDEPVSSVSEAPSSAKGPVVSKRMKASPVARRIAKENNIDLSLVKGTGSDGLIGKEDVLAFLSSGTAASEPGLSMHSRPLTEIEKVIASRMAQSAQEIPHFHLSVDVDVTAANSLRQEWNGGGNPGPHLTFTDLFVWAASHTLLEHPKLNAAFNENNIQFYDEVNIGLAVDTPKGLIVVVIKGADKKTLMELASERKQLVERAVAGEQTPEDIAGGTFTITNLGMFGIKSFNPIILPGQSGIIGIGAIRSVAGLNKEDPSGPEIINVTLTCDHRIVDGVGGAKFLKTFSQYFNEPKAIFGKE